MNRGVRQDQHLLLVVDADEEFVRVVHDADDGPAGDPGLAVVLALVGKLARAVVDVVFVRESGGVGQRVDSGRFGGGTDHQNTCRNRIPFHPLRPLGRR
ncbi:hypothetical protein [Halomicrococcus sp. NG-SE-24]|uniref:hypothetical protein n=1 Tax=Halomicrococcus sp. NG-SE-24 TaxID=3436928 RepID=UPI003D99B8A5